MEASSLQIAISTAMSYTWQDQCNVRTSLKIVEVVLHMGSGLVSYYYVDSYCVIRLASYVRLRYVAIYVYNHCYSHAYIHVLTRLANI